MYIDSTNHQIHEQISWIYLIIVLYVCVYAIVYIYLCVGSMFQIF